MQKMQLLADHIPIFVDKINQNPLFCLLHSRFSVQQLPKLGLVPLGKRSPSPAHPIIGSQALLPLHFALLQRLGQPGTDPLLRHPATFEGHRIPPPMEGWKKDEKKRMKPSKN